MINSVDRRVYLYFYASFINAGLQNVIPQVFFSAYYPHQEALLLSLCLLAGAASSIATIGLTHAEYTADILIKRPLVWIQVWAIMVFLVLLWLWKTAAPYIITFMLVRAFVQILFNRIDHYYVAQTPPRKMVKFARKSTLFRLIGVMAGPFYFALIYPFVGINIAVIIILTIILIWSLAGIFRADPLFPAASEQRDGSPSTDKIAVRVTSGESRIFLIYLMSSTTGVYVFSSNVFMIVRDVYNVTSAVAKSGTLLLLMNATGIATVALWPTLCKKFRSLTDTLFNFSGYSGQAIYALLFLVCVILLKWPLVMSYTYLLILSMFTGSVYGLFWMKTREFAIHDPEGASRGWILTLYNNANNFSILFSSVVLLIVASISAQWGGSYLNMITTALIICFGLSSLYAIRLDHYHVKNKKEYGLDVN